MNEPDTHPLTPLETALRPGAIPWPTTLEDNVAETVRRIATEAADHLNLDHRDMIPTNRRGGDGLKYLLGILDELETGKDMHE